MANIGQVRTVNLTPLYLYNCVNLQIFRGAQIVDLNELIEGGAGDSQ
jgi:hypothetical protein